MRDLAVLVLFPLIAGAQVTGRITGSVVDASGSSVPKATVDLIMPGGTRPVATRVTNTDGSFAFETLRPADYDVVIQAAGFAAYKLHNAEVNPSRVTDLPPIKLELASTSVTVDVEADLESLQVTNPEISNTVTTAQIRDLPIGDRNPLGLIITQVGVSPNQFETDINGQRSSFSTVTLDGINIQDNYIRTRDLDYIPNQLFLDQVKEFTVKTSNSSAAESGASQVHFSTPSGTNRFHGDVLWQNRNNAVTANNWFNNADGLPLPRLVLNQGGASLGGPLKHDKLYFYANYEFYRNHSETAVDQTILTDTARQGIFKYIDGSGHVQQYNLLNIAGLQLDPSILAQLREVPVPAKINNFRVGDSQPGQLMNTAGYSFLARSNLDEDNVTGRLDYNASIRHSLALSFAWNREFVDRLDGGIGYTFTPPVYNDDSRKFLSVAWRWSPSQSFTNEVRGGFNLAPATFGYSESLPTYFIGGTVWSSPTVAGLLPQGRNTRTYAIQDNTSWNRRRHTLSFGFQLQAVRVRTYDYSGTVPTYNLGFSSANQQGYLVSSTDLPGISAGDLNNANALLASLAGLLDNANETYNVTSRTSGFVAGAPYLRNFSFNNFAFYGMDSWKVLRRLTLVAGLRWDYYAPPTERDALELEPQLINGDARATLLANATLNFVGNSSVSPFYNKDLNNFAPNVGLAWDTFGNGKMVLRFGYSIHYVNDENLTVAEAYSNTNPGLQGYNYLYNLSGTISGDRPPLPAPPYLVPLSFADAYDTNRGAYFSLIDPNLRTPYVQEWNFSIQRNLRGNIIEARYVGNHATKLLRGFDYNQENITSNGFLGDFVKAQENGNLSLAATGVFNPAYDSHIPGSQPLPIFSMLSNGGLLTDPSYRTLIQQGEAAELAYEYQLYGENGSLRFFPNPDALSAAYLTNFSNSTYDSLQLEMQRRLHNRISYQVSYTFEKWLSDAAGVDQLRFEPLLDINNPKIERARTPMDLTHQFKANYVYEFPFGSVHAIQKHAIGWLLSGWSTSGILYWVSGNPFSIYSGYGTFLREAFSGTNEANTTLTKSQLENLLQFRMTSSGPYMVAASAIGPDGRGAASANSAPFPGEVFFNPGPGTIGTLQKRMFTGPSVFEMDAALIKEMRLKEHVSAGLRIEAANVFNHPTFAFFDQSINSQQFGRITSVATTPRVLRFGLRLTF